MTKLSTLSKQERDGGYYAIKGFLYQFDRTLIELFTHPNATINFECEQDIDYEDFIIQVKHKEATNFSFSSIRPAVRQLIDLYKIKPNKKFRLYCHFKNKGPNGIKTELVEKFSLEDLNKVLASEKNIYDEELKKEFLKSFEVVFLHDYHTSFEQLIELIKKYYKLEKREIAVYYHAIFQTELSKLSISSRSNRSLSATDLKNIIDNRNDIIFFEGYKNHLSEEKYFKLIKKLFFTPNKSFIAPYERIFIIDYDKNTEKETLIDLIYSISKKFYRKNSSPSPFLCIRNFDESCLNSIKQFLYDKRFYFNDGTFFHGDRFRIEDLSKEQNKDIVMRFIDENRLTDLEGRLSYLETYQFFNEQVIEIPYSSKHIKISIQKNEDIIKMLN